MIDRRPLRVLAAVAFVALVGVVVATARRAWSPPAATGGSGNSSVGTETGARRGDLEAMTKAELYKLATAAEVAGRSSMTKAQLVAALSSP